LQYVACVNGPVLAIAHAEPDKETKIADVALLDCIRTECDTDMRDKLLADYRVARDHVLCCDGKVINRTKIYADAREQLFDPGRARLLDIKEFLDQLCALQSWRNRDGDRIIGPRPGAKDDLALPSCLALLTSVTVMNDFVHQTTLAIQNGATEGTSIDWKKPDLTAGYFE
jgi:hypothetical protein